MPRKRKVDSLADERMEPKEKDTGFQFQIHCRVCGEVLTMKWKSTTAMERIWQTQKIACSQCDTLFHLSDYAEQFKTAFATSVRRSRAKKF